VATSLPPPRGTKKGLGCFGCGCLVIVLLVILFGGLMGGGGYVAYQAIEKVTSPAASAIPVIDRGDAVFNGARQKMTDFNHAVQNHQTASLHLTADEINTILARNPDFKSQHILGSVAFIKDQARIQFSVPTAILPYHLFPGRYLNGSTDFRVHFDVDEKMIKFDPQTFQLGDSPILGGNTSDSPSDQAFKNSFRQSFAPSFDRSFNQSLGKSEFGRNFLNQAKSIEIQNGELVIETQ
jgi:hypothetical protein